MAAMAATVLAASCGGGETEDDRVTAAVVKLQDDMAAGRFGAVCAALSARSQRQVGTVGHGRKPTTCRRDLRELVQSSEAYLGTPIPGLRRTRRPDVVGVEVDGAKATVSLALGSDPYEMPLVKEAGTWKLADFFGAVGPPTRELR